MDWGFFFYDFVLVLLVWVGVCVVFYDVDVFDESFVGCGNDV